MAVEGLPISGLVILLGVVVKVLLPGLVIRLGGGGKGTTSLGASHV